MKKIPFESAILFMVGINILIFYYIYTPILPIMRYLWPETMELIEQIFQLICGGGAFYAINKIFPIPSLKTKIDPISQ